MEIISSLYDQAIQGLCLEPLIESPRSHLQQVAPGQDAEDGVHGRLARGGGCREFEQLPRDAEVLYGWRTKCGGASVGY